MFSSVPSVADGINRTLNSAGSWLNAHYWDLAGPIATAAVVGAVTVVWNRYFGRRRFGWNLVWDERINQDDPSGRRVPARQADADALFRQRMWEIVYRPAEEGADATGDPPSGAWDVRGAGLIEGGQPAVTEGTGSWSSAPRCR